MPAPKFGDMPDLERMHAAELRALVRELLARPASGESAEADKLHRTLFDLSPAGILLLDEDGTILDANAALGQTSGYSREELIGQNVRMFATPEAREAVGGHLHSILSGEQLQHEVLNVRKDGSRRAVRLHEIAIPLPNNRRGILSIAEDVTERRLAEQALRDAHDQLDKRVRERTDALQASEARFRALFESAPIGIAQGDVSDVHYISANQRYCEIVGYTREELASLNFKDITHPDDIQPDLDHMARMLAGETRVYKMEKRFIRKDGKIVWCWLTVAALWPVGEKPHHFMAVLEDITARKKTEAAFRATAERLRAGVKVAGFGIFDHDHQTSDIYFSPTMREIHGFKPHEAITLTAVIEKTHPADRERFAAAIQKAHDPAGDGMFDTEHRIVRSNGEVRWVSARSQTTFAGEGKQRRAVSTIGALVDITERKLAEAKLQQAHDELEKRVAERTAELARMNLRLTAEISERMALQEEILVAGERERQRLGQNLHDGICQILTAARLKADSLVAVLADAKPAIARNIRSVAQLVSQAVDDAHGLARGLEPVEPLPEGLMAALQQLATTSGKLFHVRCECHFPQPVHVHDHKIATELFRIAQEATNNAIKHGRARCIHIKLTRNADELTLAVTSDGAPFPRKPRVGMGLKTMRFRAGRIGAKLDIERGPRGGTNVRCTLMAPAHSAKKPQPRARRKFTSPRRTPKKISRRTKPATR